MKKLALALGGLFVYSVAFTQLKSPEDFLGYKIGSRFTPHWQLVQYVRHAALEQSDLVSLKEYGVTNEGKPLMLAFVSTAENIGNLEQIRLNNLRLANLAADRMAPREKSPAIVWLSYNVHGNEASSSEAALLTLYHLLRGGDPSTKQWLRNTIVVIDPCVNPDGRDRYVNWYNSIAGKSYNPLLQSREHHEPWPGGRTNHYYFDLNRDWAWQTQVETRQRMKVYQQWMPHVHVDFHEQGINSPYYFAPAAEPLHEVITPWQRNFQATIGKNHARYFDQKGWLYFTREIFDLYYPSYGDTYPTYSGAIGMTYEQAGGGQGGLGVVTDVGDTLTLADRVNHHFTTSVSTLETASQYADQLTTEFRKFFNDAVNAQQARYKTYVIKNATGDDQRLNALVELLERNGIRYGSAKGFFRGFSYATGKEENVQVTANDIVVSAAQPRSTLIQVLFEPRAQLADSVTYDITAWALPYVFGVDAFALKEKIAVTGPPRGKADTVTQVSADAYGYVVPWEGVQSVKVLSELLQLGLRIRFSEQPFVLGGQPFARGSLIVLRANNERKVASLWQTLMHTCNKHRVRPYPVSTGLVEKGYDFGSSKIRFLKAPRVALMTGEGVSVNEAGEVWYFFDREIEYPVTLLNQAAFSPGDLQEVDVLILAAGNYRFLQDRLAAESLRNWVQNGGRLIVLEKTAKQLARLNWGLRLKDDRDTAGDPDPYRYLASYENRERDEIRNVTAGAIFRVELDPSHPLAFGYPKYYYALKQDDTIYDFIRESGWNVGVIKKENQVAGFVGSALRSKLHDGLLFGVLEMGQGNVVVLAENPLFRNFWENGKLLFSNAVFMVGR